MLSHEGHGEEQGHLGFQLNLFYTRSGSFTEAAAGFAGIDAVYSGSVADREAGAAELLGRALSLAARHCLAQWRYEEALALVERALPLLDQSPPETLAHALLTAGLTRGSLGELAAGRELVQRALALYQNSAAHIARARELSGLFSERGWLGPQRTRTWLEESL